MADDGKTAAYVSWVTFKNSVDRLAEGMPNRIDKTVFPGLSGGTLVQLLPALKFLGLIHEDGTPTEALHSLVQRNEIERKAQLKEIFHSCYAELFSLDLAKATPSQLSEKMAEHYGVTGSTLLKATRFFLNGAAEVGIPLSKYLMTAKGAGNGGTRRRIARKQKTGAEPLPMPAAAPTSASGGTSKVVNLASGGTLTVSASADFFAMSASDRKVVFSLIEQLEAYEQYAGISVPPGQSQTNEGGEE